MKSVECKILLIVSLILVALCIPTVIENHKFGNKVEVTVVDTVVRKEYHKYALSDFTYVYFNNTKEGVEVIDFVRLLGDHSDKETIEVYFDKDNNVVIKDNSALILLIIGLIGVVLSLGGEIYSRR